MGRHKVALAGADDEFVFVEHPQIPGHWRRVRGGWTDKPGPQ